MAFPKSIARRLFPRRPAACCLLVSILLAIPARGAAQSRASLEIAAFMSGTWCSDPDARGTVLEEHYTEPSANIMLGLSRFMRDDITISHEFTRITADSAGVVLTAMPSEQDPTSFALVGAVSGRMVFENLGHDFPVRIIYRSLDVGLLARIEGADGQGPEWRMRPCD